MAFLKSKLTVTQITPLQCHVKNDNFSLYAREFSDLTDRYNLVVAGREERIFKMHSSSILGNKCIFYPSFPPFSDGQGRGVLQHVHFRKVITPSGWVSPMISYSLSEFTSIISSLIFWVNIFC